MKQLDARSVATVAAGGAAGAVARHLLVGAAGAHGWAATLAVNVVGAFLLGLLLERLARGGRDTGRRRRVRLLLGTGALGGFTTYSGIAVEVLARLDAGQWAGAGAYGLGTVLAGLVACGAGVVVGARRAAR
ncbi:camphor resistance protein CrcB [Georgenia satyanarayanai]|uniref:Fluoride-specific ion channel FluC n=1 Tax=Georgenia satyanarayanai TaxID=860221 RepID=A0A2Y9C712_9MICO|nr:CrcB family protein [Georgenia satyanarayanai]PYF99021.1 camphor resistance protein CrcB [Georgenia satyanarayanai]SSA43983.1 camphor resistance protein CrcB [Georgenia satyanarayanai]